MRCLRVLSISAALAGLSLLAASPATASTYNVLYSFCHHGRLACEDGKNPAAALIADKRGNLYGTTTAGGSTNSGVIFELLRGTKKYKYQVLHRFECGETCVEGGVPVTPLIVDRHGNLYGTATAGGSDFGGTAFELSPNEDRTAWTYKVLINFCSHAAADCIDGMVPQSGLTYAGASEGVPYDGVSPLYGTTLNGSTPGTVYRLTQSGGTWTGTVLYNFCAQTGCTDGGFPGGQIAVDPSAKFVYGTTNGGGTENGNGVAYRLEIATGTQTVLHTFCSAPDCADGTGPGPGVTLASGKTLFGVTFLGGRNDGGTVYDLNGGSGKEKVLYSFCKSGGCADGQAPNAAVVQAGANLIGTASGGADFNGVIFQVGPDKSETVLHTFCQQADCLDGTAPVGAYVDPAGTIFGVTQRGGKRNDGLVYQLTALP